jgi:hypothetical protein
MNLWNSANASILLGSEEAIGSPKGGNFKGKVSPYRQHKSRG